MMEIFLEVGKFHYNHRFKHFSWYVAFSINYTFVFLSILSGQLCKVIDDLSHLAALKDFSTWSDMNQRRRIRLDFNDHQKPSRLKTFSQFDFTVAKLQYGNVEVAVQLLIADERPSDNVSRDTTDQIEKHLLASVDRRLVRLLQSLSIDEAAVTWAIWSFPAGSSGRADSCRPSHLLELISNREGEADLLTAFVNLPLKGRCQCRIVPVLLGGQLIVLNKASGGIWPIAVSDMLWRLTSEWASVAVSPKFSFYLDPWQLSFGTLGGWEAAVHGTRSYLQSTLDAFFVTSPYLNNVLSSIHSLYTAGI